MGFGYVSARIHGGKYMADTKTTVANTPIWLDLSSSDAAGSRDYYSKLFGWKVEVSPEPEYGGYAVAQLNGKDVAGIGPQMSPDAPTAWTIYVGTGDADEAVKKITAAGGKVIVEPMQVGPQGRMVIIQDPTGAFLGLWEPGAMKGAQVVQAPNSFAWAELNARGIEKASPFYQKVFGWSDKTSEATGDNPPYHEFQVKGESISGGMEMNPMVPKEVPSYWMPYFGAEDVDKAHQKAVAAGGKEMLPPQDFPGGRFSILQDPQGAAFGLMKMEAPS
jgi:predicted enzyme related to lactoylglutathione lyase